VHGALLRVAVRVVAAGGLVGLVLDLRQEFLEFLGGEAGER
jgi:hypothetical protein